MSQAVALSRHWLTEHKWPILAVIFVLGFVFLLLHELGIWTPFETPIHHGHMWVSKHLANWHWGSAVANWHWG